MASVYPRTLLSAVVSLNSRAKSAGMEQRGKLENWRFDRLLAPHPASCSPYENLFNPMAGCLSRFLWESFVASRLHVAGRQRQFTSWAFAGVPVRWASECNLLLNSAEIRGSERIKTESTYFHENLLLHQKHLVTQPQSYRQGFTLIELLPWSSPSLPSWLPCCFRHSRRRNRSLKASKCVSNLKQMNPPIRCICRITTVPQATIPQPSHG